VNQLLTALQRDVEGLRQELALVPALLRASDDGEEPEGAVAAATVRARVRRVSYVSGVISMYGLLEEYVDRLIMEIAGKYEVICEKYSDLPEALRSAHREFSLRAFIDKDRVRLREPITEDAAMQDLAACLADKSLRLNASVFTYSTANYRHDHIRTLLGRVSVSIEEKRKSKLGKHALLETGLQFGSVDALLKDLVERRNEVAHSYQVQDLLEAAVVGSYLDVVEAYVRGIAEEARLHLLRELTVRKLSPLGQVAQAWSSAIGLDLTSGRLASPCTVVLAKAGGVSTLRVLSLQADGEPLVAPVEHVGSTLKIGLGIEGAVPANPGLSVGLDSERG
jgi:hypothetical protein